MITDVQVYPLMCEPSVLYGDANGIKPYRSTVLVQIITASGLDGWGECTGALPMIVYEAKKLQNLLRGQDELQHQQILQMLKEMTPRVQSAVDIALWDLAGKRFDMPIHALLGGAVRTHVPVYASLQSYSNSIPHDQWLIDLLKQTASNHRMVKMKIGALPLEQDIQLINRALQTLPETISIAIDANQSYDETLTRNLVYSLKGLSQIAWLEEPMPLTQNRAYNRLKQLTSFPIAGGENLADPRLYIELIHNDVVDMIQPDILHIGGITALHFLYQFSHYYKARCSPHTFDSGLARLATIHAASVSKSYTKANLSWEIDPVEWDVMENPFTNLFEPTLTIEQGFVQVPQTPGLGIQIKPDVLQSFQWDPNTPLPSIKQVPFLCGSTVT